MSHKQVTGDTTNVKLLIGAGTEPHEYEPSAKARLQRFKMQILFMKMKTWKLGCQIA